MLYSIRPVRPQDAPGINAIRSMRGTMEDVLGMPSNRDEQAERFLTSLGSDDHYFVAAAVLEDGTEQVIGSVNLHVESGRMRHCGGIGLMVHPDFQGRGIGRALLDAALDIADNWLMLKRVELTVFTDNARAVALYQSLGFTRRYGLCGYLSTELLAPVPGVLQLYPTLSLLRRAIEESNSQLPWLLDPLTFATLPCQVVTLEQRAFAVLTTAGSRPVLSFLWVEPAARRQGLARELLMALAQQFPGIGTSVTVPETFTPLFAAAGYTPLSLQQYEMTMDLADAKSA